MSVTLPANRPGLALEVAATLDALVFGDRPGWAALARRLADAGIVAVMHARNIADLNRDMMIEFHLGQLLSTLIRGPSRPEYGRVRVS